MIYDIQKHSPFFSLCPITYCTIKTLHFRLNLRDPLDGFAAEDGSKVSEMHCCNCILDDSKSSKK